MNGVIISTTNKNSSLKLKNKDVSFRKPTVNDGAQMFKIVENSGVLDVNSPYSYLMWGKYFNETSIVAEVNGEIIGFISGLIQPDAPETIFVWQIAIDEKYRGNGLALTSLNNLIKQVKHKNITHLEATITPSNIPSNRLFTKLATKLGTDHRVYPCFEEKHFPDGDFEEELTYRIGPF